MTRAPVTDWTSDWDYLDPAWVSDPYPIWRALREQCPVAHTDRYGGVYLLTRYNDIRDVAYDPVRFSSRRIAVSQDVVRIDTPPLTSDPPEHRPMRMLLLPLFTPQAVAKLEPLTRRICNELIDHLISKDHCDAAVEFAQSIPVLSLSYDPKIDSVMEQFGQAEFCLDIEDADLAELTDRFDRLLARHAVERERIAATAARHRTTLQEQYDRLFGPARVS